MGGRRVSYQTFAQLKSVKLTDPSPFPPPSRPQSPPPCAQAHPSSNAAPHLARIRASTTSSNGGGETGHFNLMSKREHY